MTRKIDTTFDPLEALSLARTALDDPSGLPDGVSLGMQADTERYVIERIDEVIGALRFEPANDALAEAAWVLTHLGRLLEEVREGFEAEVQTVPGDGEPYIDGPAFGRAVEQLVNALGHIDEAIEELL